MAKKDYIDLDKIFKRTKPIPETGCLIWEGGRCGSYGRVSYQGETQGVHRVVYSLSFNRDVKGLDINQTCGNKLCVNPEHLQIRPPSVRRKPPSQCPSGHPLDENNLYLSKSGEYACKECRKLSTRRYRARGGKLPEEFVPENQDMTDKEFEKLRVIRFSHKSGWKRFWECQCSCGNTCIKSTQLLTQKLAKSCGCLAAGDGLQHSPLYCVWQNIIQRCTNPKNTSYHNYGGRGIKVCEEWRHSKTFLSWAVTSGWEEGLTIDRIDNDGDYCPKNCRWVSFKEQQRNKSTNRIVNPWNLGEMCLVEAIEKHSQGIPESVVRGRFNSGWAIEKALTMPQRGNDG